MFGHHLRSHEGRRPRCAWQKGVCPLKLFAHTKVCYLDVAIISQQQIRWFNVPVNNPLVVYCTKKYRFNINLHYIYIFPVKFIIYVQFYILKLKNSLKLTFEYFLKYFSFKVKYYPTAYLTQIMGQLSKQKHQTSLPQRHPPAFPAGYWIIPKLLKRHNWGHPPLQGVFLDLRQILTAFGLHTPQLDIVKAHDEHICS